jgi:hypothetical protein
MGKRNIGYKTREREQEIKAPISDAVPHNNPMSSSTQVANQLPWNPNSTQFPSRKDLPKLPGAALTRCGVKRFSLPTFTSDKLATWDRTYGQAMAASY